MANKRLPDNLHRLRGTYKPSRHGQKAAKQATAESFPDCPDWLEGEGRAEWVRIRTLYESLNIITGFDRGILALYCQLWGEYVIDPEAFTAAKLTQMRLAMVELGLTPSSRPKLVNRAAADADDVWADF